MPTKEELIYTFGERDRILTVVASSPAQARGRLLLQFGPEILEKFLFRLSPSDRKFLQTENYLDLLLVWEPKTHPLHTATRIRLGYTGHYNWGVVALTNVETVPPGIEQPKHPKDPLWVKCILCVFTAGWLYIVIWIMSRSWQ